jgi:acyl-CoA thioesterase I
MAALSPDHFHMNDQGYACLAEGLTAELARWSTQTPAAIPVVAVSASR